MRQVSIMQSVQIGDKVKHNSCNKTGIIKSIQLDGFPFYVEWDNPDGNIPNGWYSGEYLLWVDSSPLVKSSHELQLMQIPHRVIGNTIIIHKNRWYHWEVEADGKWQYYTSEYKSKEESSPKSKAEFSEECSGCGIDSLIQSWFVFTS